MREGGIEEFVVLKGVVENASEAFVTVSPSCSKDHRPSRRGPVWG